MLSKSSEPTKIKYGTVTTGVSKFLLSLPIPGMPPGMKNTPVAARRVTPVVESLVGGMKSHGNQEVFCRKSFACKYRRRGCWYSHGTSYYGTWTYIFRTDIPSYGSRVEQRLSHKPWGRETYEEDSALIKLGDQSLLHHVSPLLSGRCGRNRSAGHPQSTRFGFLSNSGHVSIKVETPGYFFYQYVLFL